VRSLGSKILDVLTGAALGKVIDKIPDVDLR
jgi:hypothetical protein